MRLRFTEALVLFGLSCVAACPAQAAGVQAQSGPWVVGPINLQSGPPTFCSMKNAFEGGATVVFARNTGGADSIAIDFGSRVLEAGHPYPVSVGAGQAARSISAVGATQNVLLINLSRDRAFYDALGKAEALHLSALNRAYDFSMKGSGDALQALQDCVEALAPGKKAPVRPAAAVISAPEKEKPDARLAAEVRKRRVDNAALNVKAASAAEADKLAAENTRLQKELSAVKDSLERQSDLSRQVKEEDGKAIATLKQEIARLQEKQALLARQTKEQEVQAQAQAAPPPHETLAAHEPSPPPAAKLSLEQTLIAAHVVPWDAVPQRTQEGGVAYNWQVGDLYASAMKTQARGKSFGGLVSDYFGRMAGRCGGDFAHTAGVPQASGSIMIEKAEMACVDDKDNASAALLFVGDENSFVVIAREGSQEQMEAAIAGRNAIAAAVAE